MKSIENISDAIIPINSRKRDFSPQIVTKINGISVTAPAVFKLSRKPVNIAENICAAPEVSFMYADIENINSPRYTSSNINTNKNSRKSRCTPPKNLFRNFNTQAPPINFFAIITDFISRAKRKFHSRSERFRIYGISLLRLQNRFQTKKSPTNSSRIYFFALNATQEPNSLLSRQFHRVFADMCAPCHQ